MCTVSVIVTLCKLQYRALIDSGLQSALNQCTPLSIVHGTVWQLTECDDTRYCRHTIFVPPENKHIDAQNMLRSVV